MHFNNFQVQTLNFSANRRSAKAAHCHYYCLPTALTVIQKMLSSFRLMSIALSGAVALGALPVYVPLYNAANPGMSYPTMGLGTAGGSDSSKSFGQYSECWASCNDPECTQPKTTGSCAQYTIAATTMYIQLSARLGFNLTRVDSANTYRNGDAVAKAIRLSGVPRSQIFFQSKIGPDLALGTAAVNTTCQNVFFFG